MQFTSNSFIEPPCQLNREGGRLRSSLSRTFLILRPGTRGLNTGRSKSDRLLSQPVRSLLRAVGGLVGGLQRDALLRRLRLNSIRSAAKLQSDHTRGRVAAREVAQFAHLRRRPTSSAVAG